MSGKEECWIDIVDVISQCGREEIVSLLLDRAEIEATDKEGNTSLMIACSNGCSKVIQIMLNCGAEVETKNCVGDTALMIATAMVERAPPSASSRYRLNSSLFSNPPTRWIKRRNFLTILLFLDQVTLDQSGVFLRRHQVNVANIEEMKREISNFL